MHTYELLRLSCIPAALIKLPELCVITSPPSFFLSHLPAHPPQTYGISPTASISTRPRPLLGSCSKISTTLSLSLCIASDILSRCFLSSPDEMTIIRLDEHQRPTGYTASMDFYSRQFGASPYLPILARVLYSTAWNIFDHLLYIPRLFRLCKWRAIPCSPFLSSPEYIALLSSSLAAFVRLCVISLALICTRPICPSVFFLYTRNFPRLFRDRRVKRKNGTDIPIREAVVFSSLIYNITRWVSRRDSIRLPAATLTPMITDES